MRSVVAILAVALILTATAARSEDPGLAIEVTSRQVPLNPEDFGQRSVGKLTYLGGLSLKSDASEFGGFSALLVDGDGGALTTVSDKGHWMRTRIDYDGDGQLAGVRDARVGPLLGPDGRRAAGTELSDAESLALRDGAVVVAFERVHRLWVYPKGVYGIAGIPVRQGLPMGPGYRYPYEHANGGIETLTELGDGRLLAITELFTRGEGEVRGWVQDGARNGWQALYYRLHGLFRPTGAATLPSGDLLVLERQYHWLGVPAARIVRLAKDSIRADAELSGVEIAVLSPPLVIDNLEGIATRPDGRGGVFLYLISDDNFNFLQRTLLLMFHLTEG